MSTIRYILRKDKPGKDGTFPIELVYSISGQRRYYRTREKLKEINWDVKAKYPAFVNKENAKEQYPDIAYKEFLTDKEILALHRRLQSIDKDIADMEQRFELDQVQYSPDMVLDKLKEKRSSLTKKSAPTNQVFAFIDSYIAENSLTREAGSLEVYKALKGHLAAYQTAKRKTVSFDAIDYNFFSDFQAFLITLVVKRADGSIHPRLNNVTIAKQLSTLKTFLGYAKRKGIVITDKHRDFSIKKESLEVIALTNDEFNMLYNLDLSSNKKLDQVRDVLCFSCVTGFRYSDLKQLKREHIKRDAIRLVVTKTKAEQVVPLNKYSQAILNKYVGQRLPLPVVSNQKTNEYIKELCELAEINDQIQIVRYYGAKRVETLHPKYNLVSIHTGRKTFATLSLEKGMSAEEVMKIGGWKDYKSFKRYVNITEQRTKIVMGNAWGEIQKLKAV